MKKISKLLILFLAISVLFFAVQNRTFAQQLSTSISSSYACSGFTGTSIPPNGNYRTTAFGCVNGFTDPNDNCVGACGNPPGLCNGLSGPECERKLGWFAADADRYGCFSRLKITNPQTLKAAVVIVIDRGPACSQEQAHNAPIIDLSYTAAKYVGGSTGGNYEVAHVEKVSNTTPLGPVTVTSKPTPTPTKKPTPTPTKKPTPTPTKKPTPTPTKKPSPSPTKIPTPSSTQICSLQPTQSEKNMGTFIVPFNVTTSGNYVVWTRMMAGPVAGANSFYLKIDNTCPELFGNSLSIPNNSWAWISTKNNQFNSPYTTYLTQGDHFFTIIGKEPGVKIDRLLFTNENTPCTPVGKNDMCLSTDTISPTLEPTVQISPRITPNMTITPSGNITKNLSVSLFMHGIGKSGDNANPQAFSFSNQNPNHKTRKVTVQAFKGGNQLVTSGTTNVTFNSQSGDYKGVVRLDNLENGEFYILIAQVDGYLVKKYDKPYTISSGDSLLPITLIAGDVNSDNILNILDYNSILGCMGVSFNSCSDKDADLTDNGQVDILDLNLFFREISVTSGD